jgi:hypothetical protein
MKALHTVEQSNFKLTLSSISYNLWASTLNRISAIILEKYLKLKAAHKFRRYGYLEAQ